MAFVFSHVNTERAKSLVEREREREFWRNVLWILQNCSDRKQDTDLAYC